MLTLKLLATEYIEEVELRLEHSLVSLSKWESIHEKPFFSRDPKTEAETASYVEQMLLTENPPENWVKRLTAEHVLQVNNYLESKHTATTFREDPTQRPSRDIITGELIYSWLVAFKIPFHPTETWHLNRLMTLVRIRSIQTTKQKPMSKREQAEHYRRLNEERRKQLGTSG